MKENHLNNTTTDKNTDYLKKKNEDKNTGRKKNRKIHVRKNCGLRLTGSFGAKTR